MKTALTLGLLASLTLSGGPAVAAPLDTGHAQLLGAVQARGITLYLDGDRCDSGHVDGFYVGSYKALVICNKGSRDFDANDLDTIRHEVVHFIQDCARGQAIDGNLETILKPGAAREILAEVGLSADGITKVYTDNGAGDAVPYEHEAFAIAAGMDASTITKALEQFCPLP